MLAYVPRLHPGELVYSWLARLAAHTGIRSNLGVETLAFGMRKSSASTTLPVGLARLAARLPPSHPGPVDLAERHTLYPYYAATIHPKLAKRLLDTMINGGSPALIGTIARKKMQRPQVLRFCPQCLAAMTANCGETYWRREHQLESSLVCAEHGCDLLPTDISIFRTLSYDLPGPGTCPPSPAPLPKLLDWQRERLILIAKRGNLLLEGRGDELFLDQPSFSQLMSKKGIISGARYSKQKIQKAFDDTFGFLKPVWPELFDHKHKDRWFDVFLLKRSRNVHPSAALLFLSTLEALDDAIPPLPPFGSGPWPCMNPLSDHFGLNTIEKVSIRMSYGWTMGHFVCRCGDEYSRSIDTKGRLRGISRPNGRGKPLDDFVRETFKRGCNVKALAKEAHTSAATIRAVAARLGLRKVRKTRRK